MANVHQGLRRILYKRLFYISFWHVSIQILVLQFIASVDFREEFLLWTITWMKNLLKPQLFLITLFQSLLSGVFILTESTQYLRVNPCHGVSRFRYICQKLSPNNLLWLFVYLLRGILSAIVFFVALKSYFVGSEDANHGADNLTETIVILINNAIWIHVMFFLYDFMYQKSFKYFSMIQHSRSSIMPTIILAAKDVSVRSFYYCVVFVVFYLLRGLSICSFFCYLLSVRCNLSYSTVFSPFVLYCLWLLNALFLFNNLVLKLLFDIFLTSKIDFPITADPSSKHGEFTLRDAMATSNVPLLQYLAYYDLNFVSQFDSSRRKQIFSLSYPGGHPYTWKELSNEAIKLIVDTISQLDHIMLQKPTLVEQRAYPTAELHYSNIRSLSSHYPRYVDARVDEKPEDDLVGKLLNFSKTLRPVAYFFEDLTDKQLESALQHYQALSLACYSLVNLAAASKTEDRFGIVQQDLATIIRVLLRLHVVLNKLGVVNKKPNSSVLQVKKSLISVVKSSLYKMAVEFGSYIKDLSLSVDDEKMFANFTQFKN